MTYQVLARTYRPERFDELVGQGHVVQTLTRSIENDRLAHAYIFSGPRGIGKTTTARLLAKAINCEQRQGPEPCNECASCEQIRAGRAVDVIEIDGATNNSVDEVRELREQAQYRPAQHRKKVYIIDEVHMLSKSAFNALLKTLEEPPEHVMFIFATTEVDRVPDTILSRCQRFDFRLIPQQEIVSSLERICEREEIPADEPALYLIAKFAEGSLRDAQSILDMMISYAGQGEQRITEQLVSRTWGVAPYEELLEYLRAIAQKQPGRVLEKLHEHLAQGNDLMALVADLADLLRSCLLIKQDLKADYLDENVPREILPELRTCTEEFKTTELTWMFDELVELHDNLQRHSRFQRELAETDLVRIIQGRPRYDLAEIVDRLEALEAGGGSPDEDPESSSDGRDQMTPSPSPPQEPSGREQPDPEPTPPDEPTDRPSSAPEGSPDPPSDPGDESEVLKQWDRILEAVPNPSQAYLKNARDVVHREGEVVVHFDNKWMNHVQQLRKEDNLRHLREALEEILGESYPVRILVDQDGTTGTAGETTAPAPQGDEDSTDPAGEDARRLLERTMEIFDVQEVERIDGS